MEERLQVIKERFDDNAYIEDFGDYEFASIDKRDLEWLIEQAEKVEELRELVNEAKENIQLASETVRIDEHDDALNNAIDCLNYVIKEECKVAKPINVYAHEEVEVIVDKYIRTIKELEEKNERLLNLLCDSKEEIERMQSKLDEASKTIIEQFGTITELEKEMEYLQDQLRGFGY